MQMEQKVLLKCNGICKNFGITKALKGVDFHVISGKICGLVGENGSGKSTLSAIIAGMHQATAGSMEYKGAKWEPKTVLEAQQNGIGIIVQEAGTVPMISVAENIFLGQEQKFQKGIRIDKKSMNQEVQKLFDELGVKGISPAQLTMTLNMQERKVIEIVKAYSCNPNILIVDETTNVLSHNGREILFKLIHKLAAEGKAVLIISHDIEELTEHCDLITILKDGELVTNLQKEEFEASKIKRLMIGREMQGTYYREDMDPYSDEVVLKAEKITTLFEITNLDMELHKGEILGIGGLSDSGMHTLGKVLYGEEPLVSGKVLIGSEKKMVHNAMEAVKNRIAYISKDRDTESLALNASIYDNIACTGYEINKFAGPFISYKKEKEYVDKQVKGLKIKCNSAKQPVSSMSGGNKQKVAFGKWIAKSFDIIIMDCPTRGVDIGVKQEMYHLMYEIKKQGKAILLICEELPELIGMSDRILIMKNGAITKEFIRSKELSEKDVIEYMI